MRGVTELVGLLVGLAAVLGMVVMGAALMGVPLR